MIANEFHITQSNFFTLEELIDQNKLIPIIITLDEYKV